MQPDDTTKFESALEADVQVRNGAGVAARLPDDPRQRYDMGFIRYMGEVDAEWVEIAYLLPLVIMAAKVTAGKIADVQELFKVLCGVQKRLALKLGERSKRAAQPQVRVRRRAGEGDRPAEIRPLFVAAEGSLDIHPGREPDPSFAMQRRELFPVLMTGARGMGLLPLRVFVEVRAYALRKGTSFGAFQAVSWQAETDASGLVVKIRPFDPNSKTAGKPPANVVRQVRVHYETAVTYLRGRGRWRNNDEL